MPNDASDHSFELHQQDQQETKLLDQAAQLIDAADILLIATGAGFSADSGLPTYADVAKNPVYESLGIEYGDLCRVECLKDNPQLFYGFWGTCFNLYQRQVQPHAGYQILKAWCDEKQAKLEERKRDNAGSEVLENFKSAYYLYTSNVDGHFRMAGFPNECLHEVHGAIDTWIPAILDDDNDSGDASNGASGYKNERYQVPESFSFPIDSATLLGPSPKSLRQTIIPEKSNKSSVMLRPRVLMFDDGFPSHIQMGLDTSCDRYQAWEETMEAAMEASHNNKETTSSSNPMKLVILEIGCGIRVPSVRIECQDVLQDTAGRCQGGVNDSPVCSLIRINPDHETIEQVPSNAIGVSIRGKGLETLQAIQKRINEMKKA